MSGISFTRTLWLKTVSRDTTFYVIGAVVIVEGNYRFVYYGVICGVQDISDKFIWLFSLCSRYIFLDILFHLSSLYFSDRHQETGDGDVAAHLRGTGDSQMLEVCGATPLCP